MNFMRTAYSKSGCFLLILWMEWDFIQSAPFYCAAYSIYNHKMCFAFSLSSFCYVARIQFSIKLHSECGVRVQSVLAVDDAADDDAITLYFRRLMVLNLELIILWFYLMWNCLENKPNICINLCFTFIMAHHLTEQKEIFQ